MTNTIDLDTLVLALAAVGLGNTRDVTLEYERQSGTMLHGSGVELTHALTDLVNAKRARRIVRDDQDRAVDLRRTVLFGLVPVVGMAATVCGYTDRHAATVIAVSPSGHKVTVREDKATRTDKNGMSESQTYAYEADPNGKVSTFYRHGDGRYGKLVLGVRRSYHDYSY